MKKNKIFYLATFMSFLNIFANGLLVFLNSQISSLLSTILTVFFMLNAFISLFIAYQAYKLLEKETVSKKEKATKEVISESKKEIKEEKVKLEENND